MKIDVSFVPPQEPAFKPVEIVVLIDDPEELNNIRLGLGRISQRDIANVTGKELNEGSVKDTYRLTSEIFFALGRMVK